jgi:hypothetical protein
MGIAFCRFWTEPWTAVDDTVILGIFVPLATMTFFNLESLDSLPRIE